MLDILNLYQYIVNPLYTHTRYNDKIRQFECHETFAQGVIVNKKLWENIALKLQATCFGYLLELPQ